MTAARLASALLALSCVTACEAREAAPGDAPPVVELGEPVDDPGTAGGGLVGDSGMLPAPVGQLPADYAFVDEKGAERTFGELRGKFVVLDFIFTACSGPCPPMAEAMGRLQERIRDADDVVIRSITVDPRRDTPEVLADYAEAVGAVDGTWGFARMPIGFVNTLTRDEFLVGDGGNPLAHTTKFLLLDREGRVRAHYDPLSDRGWIDKFLADLAKLRAEAP